MSAADWIGWTIATAICLAIGCWLHRVNKKPDGERIESLAIGFMGFGAAFVLVGRLAGVA